MRFAMHAVSRAALIVVTASLAPVLADDENELTVATYNCEWLVKKQIEERYDLPDDSLSDEEREQKFSQAVSTVSQAIRELDADVIGLVEVGDEADVERLRLALLKDDGGLIYPHKAVCISQDPNGQHVAVLSNLPLIDVHRQIPGREFFDTELDDPAEENDTGLSKALHVSFEFNGRKIHLYVCHFISEIQGFESDRKRVAQASIIRRHYLPMLNAGAHVIVMGDLNADRGSPTLRRLRGRDDLFGDLIQTGQARYFENDRLDQRWTYQFQGHRHQLDHVLPSMSLKEATFSRDGIQTDVFQPVTTRPDGSPVSDHRPIVVRFRFR